MEYRFIEDFTDKRVFSNCQGSSLNPLLVENNLNQFLAMKNFFSSQDFMLLVSGFLGVGKSSVLNYFLNFLTKETIVLKYNCFETTVLDDILLAFFERFKELISDGIIQEPKIRTENFTQKINSYFYSISAPIVIVIDSWQDVLKGNKSEILEFLKHLSSSGKVKVVMLSRTFDYENFEGKYAYQKVMIGALEKSLFEKMLKASGIKLIGPVSDELYKHTRGYFFYVSLAIKIIQIRGLSLYEFLDGYGKSFLSYNDFILREGLALVDPVSGHLFRLLTVIRHPVSIDLLRALNLYDDYRTRIFIETHVLSQEGNNLYLKDYYKKIAENSIPDNVAIKLHKSCVELYETQLPLKPMERNLLISRATMRSEIEYHTMFLPKKVVLKPQVVPLEEKAPPVEAVVPEPVVEEPVKDIRNIRFIFESDEAENEFMNQVADSINEFISFSEEQLEEIERDNNMSLVELMNLALKEEIAFNFKRVVMIYHRAITMKNNPDYQTFLPKIYSKLATAYAKLSDWYNALKYFEEAQKVYFSAGDLFKLAEMKLEVANVYYQMFKRDKAKEVLEKVIEMKNLPSETYVKAYIALADLVDTDIEIAYNSLKSALWHIQNIQDETLLAEVYFKFALVSDEMGETKQAVLYYKQCVEIEKKRNPYIATAYLNLAGIYEEAGVLDSAEKFYETNLQIELENKNLSGVYQASMKIATLNRKNNPQKALSFYEKAYNSAKELGEINYQVASTMAMGDFYLFAKDNATALRKYLNAQKIAQGKMSEKNLQKINRRIEDMKLQLGEIQFNEIVNGITNGI